MTQDPWHTDENGLILPGPAPKVEPPKKPPQIHNEVKLGFTIKIQEDPVYENFIEVTAYKILGIDSNTNEILWDNGNGRPTIDMEEAEVFMEGNIRWDGCSNWRFYPADNCALHFCGVEDAQEVMNLWKWIYDFAADHFPNWEG